MENWNGRTTRKKCVLPVCNNQWHLEALVDVFNKYQVITTDMLAAGLDYKERTEMLVDYIDALVELYPTCKAVVFETSKKMFMREDIINCKMPEESRFIHYAVNVRSFNIQGYDKNNPIKNGDYIDGLVDGKMSQDVQWNVQYENSLIQPIKEVIDINMRE